MDDERIIDPELNPDSPDFDMQKWRQAVADAGGIETMAEGLKQTMAETGETIKATAIKSISDPDNLEAMTEHLKKAASEAADKAQEALTDEVNAMAMELLSERLKTALQVTTQVGDFLANMGSTVRTTLDAAYLTMKDTVEKMSPIINSLSENAELFLGFSELFNTLSPYIQAELEEHPEIYGDDEHPDVGKDVPISALFAAAARRARKDGKDIPPLKVEGTEQEPTEIIAQMEALPVIFQALLPATHTSPNSRLANSLDNSVINAGELDFVVANRNKRNEISIYTMVTYDPGDGVQLTGRAVTENDRQVYDAICSIWECGHESRMFTPDTVYRAMTGTDKQPSPQQRGAITKSIEKWRRIFAKIDATNEITAYLKRKHMEPQAGTVYTWDDAMLSVKRMEARNGRGKQSVYQMNREPLLLSYSRATNKLLTAPTALLDIKEVNADGQPTDQSIDNTESRIAIKGYLWRRVLVMKHDLKDARNRLKRYNAERRKNPEDEQPERPLASFYQQSRTILFSTLFEATELNGASREIQRRNRDYAFQVLDYWRAVGHIAGYKKTSGPRNAIIGVEIEL